MQLLVLWLGLNLIAFSSLASPSFQLTPQTTKIHFSLANSHFSHSINSLLKTSSFSKYSLNLANNKFNNFLSTVIDTEGTYSQSETLESQPIFSTYTATKNSATIRSCTFTNCTSKVNGGAIILSRTCHDSKVNFCSFINCSCKVNGGAIYSESSRFWGSYCCFAFCDCGNNSYGASVYSKSDGEVSLLFYSFFQSPFHYPQPVENGVLYMNKGNQRLNSQNYSMNYGSLFGGPVLEDSSTVIIRSITMFDHIAGSMMGFYSLPQTHDISMGNIVNCSCLFGIFRLENSQAVISEFIFVDNQANLTTSQFLKSYTKIPIGESALMLNKCIFNQPNIQDGRLKVIKQYCLTNRTHRTTLRLQMMNTAFCEGVPFSLNLYPLLWGLAGVTALSIILGCVVQYYDKKKKEE